MSTIYGSHEKAAEFAERESFEKRLSAQSDHYCGRYYNARAERDEARRERDAARAELAELKAKLAALAA